MTGASRRAFLTRSMAALAGAGRLSRWAGAQGIPAEPAANFVDVAHAAGIDFVLRCGNREKRNIIESLAGGVAWIDFDNDGYPDLLLVNSTGWEEWRAGKSPTPRLFRNNRDGTFTDVSARAGFTRGGWGMGIAVGDYDNDGYDDVYITYYGGNALYHNNGDGTFTDVTARSGTRGGRFGTSCAFGDFDNDGRLDLYVTNYVDVDIDHLPAPGSSPFCRYRGLPVYCGPRGFTGERDILFHNNGDGTFTDVSERAGIDPRRYYGLGVVWTDYDGDGRPDLYVANDSRPSLLYHNNGDGTFSDVGMQSGVALSEEGREQAGMGVDAADYDNDGRIDLVKTNFSDDANNLYHNDGHGEFSEAAFVAGVGAISWPFLGFGVKFLDFDNDGWKDLLVVNGHVNPEVDQTRSGITYAERNFLFKNLRNGRFAEIGGAAGPGFSQPRVGRGAAVADYDNDGQLEILVTNLDDRAVLLRNLAPNGHHAVTVKVIGRTANRSGYGARIELRAGGVEQVCEVQSCGSYLSASDPRCHFGLGPATQIDRLAIRWPGGRVELLPRAPVDHVLIVEEGKGLVDALPFRKPGRGL